MDNSVNKNFLQTSVNDTIQRSFNMNLFNESFDKLNKIAEINQDNPAQLEIEADAYIDGTLSEIDGDTKEVYDVLKTQKNGLVDQAFRRFTANQTVNAENEISENLYKSGQIALDSYKKKLPEKIQVLESANYIKNINDSLSQGKITPNQAVELYENFSRDIIINHLGDILRDPSVSVEEKQEWIYKMIDGKTGEPSVDNASPNLRMKAVQSLLSANRQVEEYNEYMQKNVDASEKDTWEQQYLAAANYASFGGDAQTLLDMTNYLKSTAKSIEDYNKIDDIYKSLDRQTDVRVKSNIDNALNSGLLTKQEKLDLVDKNQQFLSLKDTNDLLTQINDPVERLMETSQVKLAIQEARALYGYNPMGQNNSLEYFNYELRSRLANASTKEDISNAIKSAFDETDKMYSDRTSAGRVRAIKKFTEKYDTKPEDINSMIINRIRELDKKAITNRELREKITPQAEADVVDQIVRQKGLTYDDATVMLQEAKKINSGGM